MFTVITVLSVEEVNVAHTHFNKDKTTLFRSCHESTGSTAIKSPWLAPPPFLCGLQYVKSNTSRATVKLIPVKPGTPTSPLRPGIPGRFIVSPRSPISSKNEHMSGKALI